LSTRSAAVTPLANALGDSPKAGAMGISDSTVGVLLLRARRKLKVVGREELIRAFET